MITMRPQRWRLVLLLLLAYRTPDGSMALSPRRPIDVPPRQPPHSLSSSSSNSVVTLLEDDVLEELRSHLQSHLQSLRQECQATIEIELRQVEQDLLLLGRRRHDRHSAAPAVGGDREVVNEHYTSSGTTPPFDASITMIAQHEDHTEEDEGRLLDVHDDRTTDDDDEEDEEEDILSASISAEDLVMDKLFEATEEYFEEEDLPETIWVEQEATNRQIFDSRNENVENSDGPVGSSAVLVGIEDPFIVGDTDEEEELVLSRLGVLVPVESFEPPVFSVRTAADAVPDPPKISIAITENETPKMPMEEPIRAFHHHHQSSKNVKKRRKRKRIKAAVIHKQQRPTKHIDLPRADYDTIPVLDMDGDDHEEEESTIIAAPASSLHYFISAALQSVLKIVMVAIGLTMILAAATGLARLMLEIVAELAGR
jgi:hypothetical protein